MIIASQNDCLESRRLLIIIAILCFKNTNYMYMTKVDILNDQKKIWSFQCKLCTNLITNQYTQFAQQLQQLFYCSKVKRSRKRISKHLCNLHLKLTKKKSPFLFYLI